MSFTLRTSESLQLEASNMKFRDHPLLLHRWPPTWLWGGGDRYIHAIGEVGVLKDVMFSNIEPYEKCFLIMEHEGRKYIGTLLLGDPSFCQVICAVLVEQRGKLIRDIGDIDL
jgi:hypothetical protein